jgi:hypothetical protein
VSLFESNTIRGSSLLTLALVLMVSEHLCFAS